MCCVNHKCSELTLCYLCKKARVKRYTSTNIYAYTHTPSHPSVLKRAG